MKLKCLGLAAIASTVGTSALANASDLCTTAGICNAVPEISAYHGVAAVAAVLAVVALVWERTRRA